MIDDVAPQYLKLKHWKELIGAQRDWQSNCKYGKPVQIPRGVLATILCNHGPDSSYSEFLHKSENVSLRNWTHQNAVFEFIYFGDSVIYILLLSRRHLCRLSATWIPVPDSSLLHHRLRGAYMFGS